MSKRGFTLIELLVVIAIVAILAAILFPVFAMARVKGRAIRSLSNARQMGMALQMYLQDHDEFLPLTTHARPAGWKYGDPDPNWIDAVQPYVKARLLSRLPDDASRNWPEMINLATLPAGRTPRLSSYVTNAYLNNNRNGTGWQLAAVETPASCVFVVEYRENKAGDHCHPMCWEPFGCLSNGRRVILSSDEEIEKKRYNGGANYTFVDGHAKWQRFEQTYLPASNIDLYIPNRTSAGQYGRTYNP